MATVSELKAIISADTTGYDAGLEKVGRGAEDLTQKTRGAARATDDFGESTRLAKDVLGAFGLSLGATEIVSFGREALESANSLEKTEAVVRALSGSQARFNEVMDLATAGQARYGGSLQEQLEGLRGLIPLANRSGLELAELDNVARRLAVSSPEQGIEGAAFAIKEFLASGDTVSLVERFELSRNELNALKEAAGGDVQARLTGLGDIMNELGYTQETLAAATETTANTYDRLGASADNAKVAIGAWLSEALEPAAEGAIALADAISGRGLNETLVALADTFKLVTTGTGLDPVNIQIFSDALEDFGIQSETTRAQVAQGATAYNIYSAAAQQTTRAVTEQAEAVKLSDADIEKLGRTLEQTAERGAQARKRLAESEQRYSDRTQAARAELARKVEELQEQSVERLADLDETYAQRRADTLADEAARVADLQRDGNAQLLSDEADYFRSREQAAQASADKVADLQSQIAETIDRAARDAEDRQRTYEERVSDLQQRGQDSRADRQQDHVDKLADLQARLGQATTAEQQARIQEQIAAADREFAQAQERATRDEARAIEKLTRDREREAARAAEKLAQQQTQLQAEIAQEQAAAAARAAQDEADYQARRAATIAKYTQETTDAREAAAAQLAELASKHAQERAATEQATARKIAQAEEAAAREAEQRAAEYAKQQEQLRAALGEQLLAYTTTQLQMTQITVEEAEKRRAAIQAQFGTQDAGAGFGAVGAGQQAGNILGATQGLLGGLGLAVPGLGALQSAVTQSNTIIVNGAQDPQAVALAVRDELDRISRQNGSTGIGSGP